jgi:hypothetical protein
MESLLAERIVGLAWRLRRAERLQAAAFDTLPEEKKKWLWSDERREWIVPQTPQPGSEAECLEFGERIVHDFAQTRILDRLLVYERRIEHSLYRTMAELRNLRKEQGVSSGNKSVKCAVSSLKSESETSNRPVPAASNFTLPTSDSALECEVSSLKPEGQAASPPGSNFTPPTSDSAVPTSDFKLDTAAEAPSGETPDGVTTNVPEAQEPSCETKPIREEVSSLKCEVSSEESEASSLPTSNFTLSTSDSTSAEPPDGVTTNTEEAQEPSCETKPIGGGVSSVKWQVASEAAIPPGLPASNFPLQTLTEPPCETKPISAGAKKDRVGYRPIFRRRR